MQNNMGRQNNQRNRKKPPFWGRFRLSNTGLFIVATLLFLLVLFLANKQAIDHALGSTGFLSFLGWDQGPEAEIIVPNETERPQISITQTEPENPINEPIPWEEDRILSQLDSLEAPPSDETTTQEIPDSQTGAFPEESPSEAIPQEVPDTTPVPTANGRSIPLFFVMVNHDGRIELGPVNRTLDLGLTPLTRVVEALLAGPSAEDLSRGYLTLIPQGTRLLSASVRDGVAYLNFSEEFQFNTLGLEGYTSQIRQIIYTVTEINNIDRVQFRINGQTRDYLGPEGLPIGSPLGRENLRF